MKKVTECNARTTIPFRRTPQSAVMRDDWDRVDYERVRSTPNRPDTITGRRPTRAQRTPPTTPDSRQLCRQKHPPKWPYPRARLFRSDAENRNTPIRTGLDASTVGGGDAHGGRRRPQQGALHFPPIKRRLAFAARDERDILSLLQHTPTLPQIVSPSFQTVSTDAHAPHGADACKTVAGSCTAGDRMATSAKEKD
jgi:hypothetical protein